MNIWPTNTGDPYIIEGPDPIEPSCSPLPIKPLPGGPEPVARDVACKRLITTFATGFLY